MNLLSKVDEFENSAECSKIYKNIDAIGSQIHEMK